MVGGEEVARLLRDRAESYGQDGTKLRQSGDTAAAVIYETIAKELRACAQEVSA